MSLEHLAFGVRQWKDSRVSPPCGRVSHVWQDFDIRISFRKVNSDCGQFLNSTLTEVGKFAFGRPTVGDQFVRKIDKENNLKEDKWQATPNLFSDLAPLTTLEI
jgi:hypothetical protein